MHLTLLAPDIVEAIFDGREPSGLSLERLVKDFSPFSKGILWVFSVSRAGSQEPGGAAQGGVLLRGPTTGPNERKFLWR